MNGSIGLYIHHFHNVTSDDISWFGGSGSVSNGSSELEGRGSAGMGGLTKDQLGEGRSGRMAKSKLLKG